MKNLDNKELEEITGGFNVWVAVGIAAMITFVSGIVDGIVHPNKCT